MGDSGPAGGTSDAGEGSGGGNQPDETDEAGEPPDTYDVTTWEVRGPLDRVAVAVHRFLRSEWETVVVLFAVLLLIAQFALVGLVVVENPLVALFVLLSALPAFALAGYIWYYDPTDREPVGALAVTFVLGALFANIAAFLNSVPGSVVQAIPLVGPALFFFLVVGPVEETVKWLAVRVYPYERGNLNAVVNGAVYGAAAGLGFATIENGIYVVRGVLEAAEAGAPLLQATVGTTIVRSLAGPGHVIYSSFAGYYLGLAAHNRENFGPIAVKGLLVASLIHGLYNTVVTYVPLGLLTFLGFVVVYDGFFAYLLYRKLRRYRDVTGALGAAPAGEASVREDADVDAEAE